MGGQAKVGSSGGAGDEGGGVQQAVAELLRFSWAQVTVEAGQPGPAQQVMGDEATVYQAVLMAK